MTTQFTYHNELFTIIYDPDDRSGLGAIQEIVTNNDYKLDLFCNQKNKTFFDIGTNIGIATVIMAKLNPESVVYAFEPFTKAYELLLQNIKINNLTNVVPHNLAVSNKTNKTLNLSILNWMSGANSTYSAPEKFDGYYHIPQNIQTIECISFDEIMTKYNINKVHLLKIDCEGAEFDIIYDSELFKSGVVENIVGEFHDLSYNKALNQSSELITYCKKYINGLVNVSILTV